MARIAFVCLIIALVVAAFFVGRQFPGVSSSEPTPVSTPSSPTSLPPPRAGSDFGSTDVYAHNLMLRKGPSFRIYVRWLRGQLVRARRNLTPSFDDPDSFYLDIQDGVVRANIGDIGNYLNAGGLGNSPLKNVKLSGDGARISIRGTLYKVVSLPVQVTGELAVMPDGRIRFHVTKINVLKIPFKGLLGVLHVTVADLAGGRNIPGIQISGNDILFDTQALLPPPHIRGKLTAVRVANPDLEEVFGNAQADLERVEQWRNFLRLKGGGSIDFGKLTMHQVDLIMIDVSNDAWFDLDLAHYQEQLVYGYTRMTPQAGLQIFMPDLRNIPQNANSKNISLEWMKNREAPVPKDVAKQVTKR